MDIGVQDKSTTQEKNNSETAQPTTAVQQEQKSTGQGSTTESTSPVPSTERPWWLYALIAAIAVLLAGLIAAPLSLSGQDIMSWARTGLGLSGAWPWIVFYSLDATAIICVLITVYAAWEGKRASLFQIMIWVIACASAFANYRHGLREGAPVDAWWFFPAMSILSPLMLELVLAHLRRLVREREGQTANQLPKFGFWRWIPGVGSFKETYGAWRTARLLNLSSYNEAVLAYRALCPDGSIRVLDAIRKKEQSRTPVGTVQPVVLVESTGPSTNLLDNPEEKVQDKIQVQRVVHPEEVQDTTGKTTKLNEDFLAIMRQEWPTEIPPGNKVRTKFKELTGKQMNYKKARDFLELHEQQIRES